MVASASWAGNVSIDNGSGSVSPGVVAPGGSITVDFNLRKTVSSKTAYFMAFSTQCSLRNGGTAGQDIIVSEAGKNVLVSAGQVTLGRQIPYNGADSTPYTLSSIDGPVTLTVPVSYPNGTYYLILGTRDWDVYCNPAPLVDDQECVPFVVSNVPVSPSNTPTITPTPLPACTSLFHPLESLTDNGLISGSLSSRSIVASGSAPAGAVTQGNNGMKIDINTSQGNFQDQFWRLSSFAPNNFQNYTYLVMDVYITASYFDGSYEDLKLYGNSSTHAAQRLSSLSYVIPSVGAHTISFPLDFPDSLAASEALNTLYLGRWSNNAKTGTLYIDNVRLVGPPACGTPTASPTPSHTPAPMACGTPTCSGGWTVIGNGYVMPDGVHLTDDAGYESTAMWSNFKLDLTQSFTANYQLYFGTKDATGADGIVFLMHNDPRGLAAIGATGQGLSYASVPSAANPGISPSVAIEFDTWQNNNSAGSGDPIDYHDPAYDHSGIHLNGNGDENADPGGVVQTSATSANIEDGLWHQVSISWDRPTNTLRMYFDGALRLTYNSDIVANVFGGTSCVYWGFTAGTGGSSNEQMAKEESCNTPTPTSTPTATSTHTSTPTSTRTRTATATSSSTNTMTSTPSRTVTTTSTPSSTATPTRTPTVTPSSTPSASSTASATSTSTVTRSSTATVTPSSTATHTETITPSVTVTASPSGTPTSSSTRSPGPSPTYTATATPTPTVTATVTVSFTPSVTATPTATRTHTTTVTVTSTPSATPTFTITISSTSSLTVTQSSTFTFGPSPTPTHTPTISPSATSMRTATPSATATATFSGTPSSSVTSTLSATPSITVTPTGTSTNSATQTQSVMPSATDTITIGPSPTSSPTFTVTLTSTVTATSSGTATVSVTPTLSATSTPTLSFSGTPSSTVTATVSASLTQTAPNSPSNTPTISVTTTQSSTATLRPSASPSATASPTLTVSPTESTTFSASPTPVPLPLHVRVSIYNAAGELVRMLYDGGAQLLPGQLSLSAPIASGPDGLSIVFPGSLGDGNGGSRPGALQWDLTNDNAQPVGGGVYYLRAEFKDPFGQVQVLSASVQVLPPPPPSSILVFNAAGEVVRHFNLAPGSAFSDLQVPDAQDARAGDNGFYVKSGQGLQTWMAWDGSNDQGQSLNSGVYTLVLQTGSGSGAPMRVVRSINIIKAPLVDGWGQISVAPNPVRGTQAQVNFQAPFKGGVRLELYNLAGERVCTQGLAAGTSQTWLDTTHLSSGIYMLVLENLDGPALLSRRVVRLAIVH